MKKMFTKKLNAASILAGNEKELGLFKRVKLTQEFEEASEVVCLLKVSPTGFGCLSCYIIDVFAKFCDNRLPVESTVCRCF